MTNKSEKIIFYSSEPVSGRSLNGRKVHEPKGTKYIIEEKNYQDYLKEIQTRLKTDVGAYLDLIVNRPTDQPAIGFFSLVRMLMPVIETVARAHGMDSSVLLRELSVPAPTLIWNLYRDMFIHNDGLMIARIEDQTIFSAISITPSSTSGSGINMHRVSAKFGRHQLDVGNLYYDLIDYLDKKTAESTATAKIEVIIGIEYLKKGGNPEVDFIIFEAQQAQAYDEYKWDRFYRRIEAKRRRQMPPQSNTKI